MKRVSHQHIFFLSRALYVSCCNSWKSLYTSKCFVIFIGSADDTSPKSTTIGFCPAIFHGMSPILTLQMWNEQNSTAFCIVKKLWKHLIYSSSLRLDHLVRQADSSQQWKLSGGLTHCGGGHRRTYLVHIDELTVCNQLIRTTGSHNHWSDARLAHDSGQGSRRHRPAGVFTDGADGKYSFECFDFGTVLSMTRKRSTSTIKWQIIEKISSFPPV